MNPTVLTALIESVRASFHLFWPEVMLLSGLVAVLFLDLFIPAQRKRHVLPWVSLLFVLVTLMLAWRTAEAAPTVIFSGLLVVDPFAAYMKVFLGLATVLAILISVNNKELAPYPVGEYHVILMGLYFAAMLLVSAVNLLMIMLALEMVSVSSYLLVAYRREVRHSIEGAMKYIVFGAAASGTMLYAVSWIYGLTGTVYLDEISRRLAAASSLSPGWIVIMMLLLAGIAFKVSAVPFHFWAPDAYQGAATPVTAYLTVAPKAAGFAMLVRILYHGFSVYRPGGTMGGGSWEAIPGLNWPVLVAFLSVATMTWGNTVALWQKNIKRMLAYSSIGHAGYMLMAALVMTRDGLNALLFYFFAYMLMNMGAFTVVIALGDVLTDYENIEAYRGLGRLRPGLVLAMAVFLLSLAGIPPLIGFFGKFFLFAAAVNAGWSWLAVVAVINSAISLFYYVYVIKNMVMEPGEREVKGAFAPLAYRMVMVMAAAVFILGIFFAPFYRWARSSSEVVVDFRAADVRTVSVALKSSPKAPSPRLPARR